jgi:hypothetical protein
MRCCCDEGKQQQLEPHGSPAATRYPPQSSAPLLAPASYSFEGLCTCGALVLRNAWDLLAPNDLLSVLAAAPPGTPSYLRSGAPAHAQW